MPPSGPTLPTNGEKRRHDDDDKSGSEDEYGPTMPDLPRKRKSTSPEPAAKRSRIIGPSMPPANLDERPPDPPESNDEDSDEDDFGPALPSAATNGSSEVKDTKSIQPSAARTPAPKTARDEWMLVPPSSGDWTSRVDPTKLKSRTFNTGKSAKGIPQATDHDNAKWTETPAEKKARLEREMMGIQEKPMPKIGSQQDRASEATARKLKEYTEKSRGETLFAEHQRRTPVEKEDDPSARAFDREKDIAGGVKIGHAQRKEMMKRAADFGSRFSGAKYL